MYIGVKAGDSGFEEFKDKLKEIVCELIENKHTELGIPEDRVKFIQNKWKVSLSDSYHIGIDVEHNREIKEITAVCTPETFRDSTLRFCSEMGVNTHNYNEIWTAVKKVAKDIRDNKVLNIDANKVTIDGMGAAVYTWFKQVVVEYKGIYVILSDGRTGIAISNSVLKDIMNNKVLNIYNLDKVMVAVLGILCVFEYDYMDCKDIKED